MVAADLRGRIISGQLKDGDWLPRQEDLLDEFQVSKPSLREGLRILENEGLITVRRGNRGGAMVHAPAPANAAYVIGMSLQFQDVPIADVAQALLHLEPVCAQLCAARPDRHEEVLPVLQDIHAQFAEAVDDAIAFTRLSRQFHEEIVSLCGNDTLIVVMGALNSLWANEWDTWVARARREEDYPDRQARTLGVRAHARILRHIEQGQAEASWKQMGFHLESALRYVESGTQPE
jgi:DNA-binding FadR family transcriptional regulator